ncbi:TATA element modulatory factor 1 TATA binding domain-containing protein [Trichoderma breve]|uniref:TATA element modulatory factor 1 TATA binding domain-containing protein n=1 Tax=Trichoderma breve TaxID=2034170 RepID=A0A9W9BII9_9HYPO|nr:TATA element modulatory factor 1 TATA binding domain-containing protein [Trichoderma breve]KAJ4860171.1 TATA element modulatory factor 1 TATA binding domain-containing protein [Trichoderma breve]
MAARWGSFLQQAVAGVESRLDNILAEGDDDRNAAQPAATSAATLATASPKVTSSANSRASSTNRANDRLQARLAKAMAGKNAPGGGDNRANASPRSSIDVKPEPEPESESAQTATDSAPTDTSTTATTTTTTTIPITITDDNTTAEVILESAPDETKDALPETEVQPVSEEAPAKEGEAESPPSAEDEIPTNNGQVAVAVVENGADASEISRELEEAKLRHREEVQEYVERIDSLQSKIQYLSKNAAEAANKAASSAPSGSLEKKLAEKDERIALLMEEGQKLAGADHKYRTLIKSLRLQISERDKQLDEARKAKDKAVLDAEALRNRLDGDEEKEKRRQEAIKATTSLRKEIDNLKRENTNKDAAIRRLEQEVRAKEEQERAKQKELEDANTAVRAELEALSEKARLDAIEWGEKLERAIQRGSTVEAELRLELQNMESKLEGVRVTAEEAASSTGGEAQMKLFRQIETLQSQYATARQNWQGIEASLMAKTTSLERERDEAERRESEMRKKARDAAKRGRTLEDELQEVQLQLEACREELATLKKSTKATETALEQTRSDLEKEKQAASRSFTAETGRQWADEVAVATARNQSRPESPLLSVPRTFSSEAVGLSVPNRIRRSPTPVSIADAVGEGLGILRRPPTHLPTRTGTGSMSLTGSIPPSPFSPLEPPMGSPPALPPSVMERENGISDTAPSSPRNLAQDMISVSTVAAGPSVQLVERMSAAIRRLEAERVAAKEEMARVCSQRDEARGDMVALMKELEDAKAASARVPELEKEVADLDTRYQTTLELLGEKSELVDELRADVDDVKTMYRELIERTVK